MATTRQIDLVLAAKNRTNKAFDSANKNLSKLERNVKNIQRLGNVFTSLFAVNQIAGYAQDLGKIADEWKNIEGRLKLVTGSSEELIQVQDDLFKISQETASSYTETAKLYTQVARNSEELGLSNKELLSLTETINKSIQVSGASSQASEAAITQLNQALGSGVLRGDEFNSVMEQAPRLAQAMADGLGVPIGALRQLAEDGELTAERVTKALLDQKDVIEKEYATLPDTIGRSITKLNNEWLRFIGEVDKSTGSSDNAAKSINALSAAFNAVTNQVDRFSEAFSYASDISDKVSDALLKIIPGADFIRAYLDLEEAQTKSNIAAEKAIENSEKLKTATDELTESEYALQFAQEKENDILAARDASVQNVLDQLKEESDLLKLSGKEQFIYNQIKKAGADISAEQAQSIRDAAGSIFDEKEALKAVKEETRSVKEETKELSKATTEYKKTADSVSSGSSTFGQATKEAEELTKETEKATKAKKEWFSSSTGEGVDPNATVGPLNLTPEMAEEKAQEIITAMQNKFNANPVQVKVNVPTANQVLSPSTTTEPQNAATTFNPSFTALKEGTK